MEQLFAAYAAAFPDLAAEFERTQKGQLKPGFEKSSPASPQTSPSATRNAGYVVLNAIADAVPELFGGAADLTASTKTIFKPGVSFHVDPAGRNVFFGVRELAMSAAVNGMACHGGLIPFGSTFFVFSDYGKPAMRLSALMQVHSLFVFYPRLHRRRRRRPHPPAHRAAHEPPRCPRPHRLPPRRRQ